MISKAGVLRLCGVLLSKLLAWMVPVVRACGAWCVMIAFHYLLQLIRWLLRQTEEVVKRMATKLEMLNTPKDANGVNADDSDGVANSEDTASDNGESYEEYSGDADTIAAQHPVNCDSDSSYDSDSIEQVKGVAASVKEKLSISVECTEESSPQELVIAGYKPFMERKKLTVLRKLDVEKDVEDKPVVKDDMAARPAVAVTGNSHDGELDENSNTDYLDFEEEEKFYCNGAVQKSDNSGGNEVMVTVRQYTSVIEDEGGFTSHVEFTEEAAQQSAAGKEENDNKENQQAAPPMPFNSAGVITANQNDQNYYETNCLTDNIE